MITFFTDPYDEELISSIFARYHYYSGNIDIHDTLEELLGERNISAFKMFPSRLRYLEKQFRNPKYTSDYFIYKHTNFPFYSVFLAKNKQKSVINYMNMKEKSSDTVESVLAISKSRFYINNGYMYCPKCMEEEINLYGEAYFHRIHQIQGIFVCEKHECKLIEYIEKYKLKSDFCRLNINIANKKEFLYYDKDVNDKLVMIAQAARYIIDLDYLKYSKDDIIQKLYRFLEREEYLTIEGKIQRSKLLLDIKKYYGEKIFQIYKLNLVEERVYWIKSIFSKSRSSINPIETILLIIFLSDNNMEEFFCDKKKEKPPFGIGPWPCLNPICHNYKKDVINEIRIENSCKSRLPSGIFRCEKCGYTYRRKGPDKNESDKYKKSKVLEFGPVWESEFKKAVAQKYKTIEIVKRFDIYKSFIYYYQKNGALVPRSHATMLGKIQNNFEEYSNAIKEYIKKNPEDNRTNILNQMKKEAFWLINYYPDWLEQNLPKPQKYKSYSKKKNFEKNDDDILEKVKIAYDEFISINKKKRITIGLMEKLVHRKIRRNIYRLPKTKAFLEIILEDLDKYSIRIVEEYCDNLIRNNKYTTKNQIIRNTGRDYKLLSDECRDKIDSIIEKYLSGFNKV
ncbi:hypothetical protein DWV13_03690 [Clostridium botulinum]|uniref:TnsD family Tn7-like transposition protein n=1 Tax=Clostridium TaxID=1485 RepID=UPI0013F99301|nr:MULTISPECIES: TnsD family Tn7-like transposition protein [Clostridium]MCS6130765.1 hypothetical protein [Clostridium botulinum]NFL44726.1 hypothetical protein [Clostridium botulinum]NFL89149.1 hypothetical protein [Clostridium botulinum]